MKTLATASMVAFLATGLVTNVAQADRRSEQIFELTFTNVTPGQIISPLTVFTHTSGAAPLYTLGQPASAAVAAVAEDASADLLLGELSDSMQVGSVVTVTGAQGPIMPGETVTVRVKTSRAMNRLSLIGMLVTTNDAFVGIAGAKLNRRGDDIYAMAYDAGTEVNTESCEHIPGPPCGNGGQRVTDGAEGFVHVHSGIHGIGDLAAYHYDWKNPVAAISIRKVY